MPTSSVAGSASTTASSEASRSSCEERGGQVGADHVERAVGEVDEVHDAEDQRQPGRHQEQHHAELQPVEALLDDEQPAHRRPGKRKGRGDPRPCRSLSHARYHFIAHSWQ